MQGAVERNRLTMTRARIVLVTVALVEEVSCKERPIKEPTTTTSTLKTAVSIVWFTDLYCHAIVRSRIYTACEINCVSKNKKDGYRQRNVGQFLQSA